MKLLRIALLAASLASLLSGTCRAGLLADPISTIADSAVSLYEYETDTAGTITSPPQAVCSGFVIAVTGTTETVITAKHCVTELPEEEKEGAYTHLSSIHFLDGDHGAPSLVLASTTSDLAEIIVTTDHPHPALTISTTPLVRNQDLYVYGAPLGAEWSLARAYAMQGNVIQTFQDPLGNQAQDIEISCDACAPGISGGEVTTTDGELVGVLTLGVSGGVSSSQHWMVPASAVVAFAHEAQALRDHLEKKNSPATHGRVSLEPLTTRYTTQILDGAAIFSALSLGFLLSWIATPPRS